MRGFGALILSPVLCLTASIAIIITCSLSASETSDRGGEWPVKRACVHASRIDGVVFSSDGRSTISASMDGSLKTCEMADGRQRTIATSRLGGFSDVSLSPDGHALAAGTLDGRVVISELYRPGRSIALKAGDSEGAVRVAVFSPDGTSVAAGGDDRAVRLWDLASGSKQLEVGGHDAMVRGLAFSPDGRTIRSASADGRSITWDVQTGHILDSFIGRRGPLWSIAISRDGRWVALGGQDGISLRDLKTGDCYTRQVSGGPVMAVAFLPCGTILASASLKGSINLWDIKGEGLRLNRTLKGQDRRVKSLAVSPDGKTLVTGSDDATLRFWDL